MRARCTGTCGSSATASLASWAVPKGIPPDPRKNHLAVRTEDHPLEYLDFHGEIPAGQYGAGTMKIWDRGTYETHKWRDKEVMVTFHGERVQGRYVLFRTDEKNWMIHRMDPPQDPDREPFPDRIQPMIAKTGPLPRDDDALGVRDQVGRRARDRLRRGRAHAAARPQRERHHAALPGAARARPRAGGPRGGARRRGRVVRRRGPPELPAPPEPHAPHLRARRPPALAERAGRLRHLRPAVARRALADRPAVHRAARAAARARPQRRRPGRRRRSHVGDGAAMLEASRANGLEGIVAKRLDSTVRARAPLDRAG